VLIKVCGITTLDDALACIDAGVTALGFNLWPGSSRYIDREAAAAIASRLPREIERVALFVDTPAGAIEAAMADSAFSVAQVHGDLDRAPAVPFWQAWSAATAALADLIRRSPANAFLIDAPAGAVRGGAGKTFDWNLAANLPGRIVLAGGLDGSNVGEAIRAVSPWGVDACSRLETSPGIKDHAKVRAFAHAARAAASALMG
jgi:phosphoribosylanthranilate isomerase